MNIYEIRENKELYMPLLLLGDEQENMIQKYLYRGDMYVLNDDGIKAVCIVTDEGDNILEIKNIAVLPESQRKGYGRNLIRYIERTYKDRYRILQVGTGDSPLTIPFYTKCGFAESHRVKNFFINHYDHPIIECGVQLTDMVYLRKNIFN